MTGTAADIDVSRDGAGTVVPLNELMLDIGRRARKAGRILALASDAERATALRNAARAIRDDADGLLAANAEDVAEARAAGRIEAFIDRLQLTPARVEAIASAVEAVADLPDPVGRLLATFNRPNGLVIERVAVPLGVIGVIFESRPNVAADAGSLCVKAGNAAVLRAGSESFRSAARLVAALRTGLEQAGLPADAVQIVPVRDRDAVGLLLGGLEGTIDVIVPRGGKGLVGRVQAEARVPVFAHLDGVCHVYVHADADLEMARTVLLNAKLRRTGICGAAETLLVDRAVAGTHLKPLVTALLDAGCEVRGDAATQAVDERVKAATDEDWRTEYEDAIISAKVVDDIAAAIDHIETYGSHHTDSIITANGDAAVRFQREVDSAIVAHNASTQFADGGEFGFGAEIGIATGRMHARGPVGVEQLTSFKYRIHGNGQTRP
ncbi:glutamate-5-semialdehyde dehydrogenase [Pseudochelatococcus contaminans]|uniref:Gamma-glutamyl phosphate reductase n=2 Tax=Pseudochelatococcus contaminans TaxID=1538103 RepID=A0A7W5Z4R6_9HYPH|nr:glutamate-5-semialdehyde dehydrogenase [Pseudochelatococcus contaminans]